MKKILNFVVMILFVLVMSNSVQAANVGLAWDAPTTNEDGTPLTDLAGYKVYYGTESTIYTESIDVGSVLTYQVNGLSDGTYYFAVTAYDTSMNESNYSNEVSTVIAIAPSAPALRNVEIVAGKFGVIAYFNGK